MEPFFFTRANKAAPGAGGGGGILCSAAAKGAGCYWAATLVPNNISSYQDIDTHHLNPEIGEEMHIITDLIE